MVNFLLSMRHEHFLLRNSLAILGLPKQREMVNFLLSMRHEHFLLRNPSAILGFPKQREMVNFLLSMRHEHFLLRNPSAVLDSPRPGRIMNFWSSVSFQSPSTLNFHSPSIAVLSSTIDDRYATLPFTTDPRTCIHHRPQRFHLGFICSVSGNVSRSSGCLPI